MITVITLSVIVCTYNRLGLLLGCIHELTRQIQAMKDAPIEVVIVENNCTDGTEQEVGLPVGNYPWLNLVKEDRQGLSYARNCGAREAQGTYLCYLDDDARPGPEYLQRVLQIIGEHKPDIFSGPIFPFYTSPKPFWFQDILEIRQHADKTGFADCLISGGNFIIRADLLKKLGMFSPEFGMIGKVIRLGEDRELLERYKRNFPRSQQRIYYSLECYVYHHVPDYKMTLGYFISRAYQSGKMRVLIGDETLKNLPVCAQRATKNVFNRLWTRITSRGEDVSFFIMGLHRLASVIGIIIQYLKNFLSHNKKKKWPTSLL